MKKHQVVLLLVLISILLVSCKTIELGDKAIVTNKNGANVFGSSNMTGLKCSLSTNDIVRVEELGTNYLGSGMPKVPTARVDTEGSSCDGWIYEENISLLD